MIKRIIARVALAVLVGAVLLVHIISRLIFFRRTPFKTPCRVLMIGTFESPGWLLAHAGPLSACKAVSEVGIVCTTPFDIDLPKIRFYCPSRRTIDIFGRQLARIIILLKVAIAERPSIYMGYHIMPNSLYALVLARVFGGRAIYQMTGGPIQLIGGGYQSENPLLAATGAPCRFMEYILFSLVRCFDIVIVRGKKAQSFVRQHQLAKQCFIITGAIDTDRFTPASGEKDFDILYVGRLVNDKGVEQCIRVAAKLRNLNSRYRLGIVGDGPLQGKIQNMACEYRVDQNVHFFGKVTAVERVLSRARLFLLLSPSEGMSIAMLEAMSCGLPAVVSDVGDLADAFEKRPVGVLLNGGSAVDIANQVNKSLKNKDELSKFSLNARKTICERFSVQAIARRWQEILICMRNG